MSRRPSDEIRDQEHRAAGRTAYRKVVDRWESRKAAAIDLDLAPATLSGLLSDDPDRAVTLARLREAVAVAVETFPEDEEEILSDVVRGLFGRDGSWVSPGAVRPVRPPLHEAMDVVGKATRLAERILAGAPQDELEMLAGDVVSEAHEARAAVAK